MDNAILYDYLDIYLDKPSMSYGFETRCATFVESTRNDASRKKGETKLSKGGTLLKNVKNTDIKVSIFGPHEFTDYNAIGTVFYEDKTYSFLLVLPTKMLYDALRNGGCDKNGHLHTSFALVSSGGNWIPTPEITANLLYASTKKRNTLNKCESIPKKEREVGVVYLAKDNNYYVYLGDYLEFNYGKKKYSNISVFLEYKQNVSSITSETDLIQYIDNAREYDVDFIVKVPTLVKKSSTLFKPSKRWEDLFIESKNNFSKRYYKRNVYSSISIFMKNLDEKYFGETYNKSHLDKLKCTKSNYDEQVDSCLMHVKHLIKKEPKVTLKMLNSEAAIESALEDIKTSYELSLHEGEQGVVYIVNNPKSYSTLQFKLKSKFEEYPPSTLTFKKDVTLREVIMEDE